MKCDALKARLHSHSWSSWMGVQRIRNRYPNLLVWDKFPELNPIGSLCSCIILFFGDNVSRSQVQPLDAPRREQYAAVLPLKMVGDQAALRCNSHIWTTRMVTEHHSTGGTSSMKQQSAYDLFYLFYWNRLLMHYTMWCIVWITDAVAHIKLILARWSPHEH